MHVVPGGTVVFCKKVLDEHSVIDKGGILVESENVPEFEVIASNYENTYEGIKFNPGDIVYARSTGLSVDLDDGRYFLFHPDYLMGKKA